MTERISQIDQNETVKIQLIELAVRETDDRIVGCIDLRHTIDNPVLSAWGGHMVYRQIIFNLTTHE